jgi:hypothetical protein
MPGFMRLFCCLCLSVVSVSLLSLSLCCLCLSVVSVSLLSLSLCCLCLCLFPHLPCCVVYDFIRQLSTRGRCEESRDS